MVKQIQEKHESRLELQRTFRTEYSSSAAELKTEIEADLFCGLSLFALLENQSKIHHMLTLIISSTI